ncbi:MAG: M23 family metallopeptidase [bacterium]|nr:M23 family metallopeptidase [bacterium]
MKPKTLLVVLRALIYTKRMLWWAMANFYFVLAKIFNPIFRSLSYLLYKVSYFFKRTGFHDEGGWFRKREFLQFCLFMIIIVVVLPQTKLFSRANNLLAGQKTVAYSLIGQEGDYSLEEVTVGTDIIKENLIENRNIGLVGGNNYIGAGIYSNPAERELAGIVAGGTAFSKPNVMPGVIIGTVRSQPIDYTIQTGDSLSGIAYQFGISVATIMWENDLALRTILKPGNKIVIPPITGIMHKVKKGDNLNKIATLYDAKTEDIIAFNKLKEDGTDIVIGERIMIPGGVRPEERVYARAPVVKQTASNIVRPASSRQAPTMSGFVWPSAGRIVTQYYNWKHHAIDIAGGGMGTAIYVARSGTVIKSQCGWNGGYGCHIIVDHGGGVKSLYAHNSRLLVNVGDYVETGQTIALMGNTGNVRGVTGIHLHFEIIVNGSRMNPLSYVR